MMTFTDWPATSPRGTSQTVSTIPATPVLTDAQEIRAGLEAVAHAIGALAVAVRPSLDAEGCQHPEESRDYSAATMGRIQWTCACGYHFDPKGDT